MQLYEKRATSFEINCTCKVRWNSLPSVPYGEFVQLSLCSVLSEAILLIDDGEVFLSIDGTFGLCRKQAAGTSVCGPIRSGTFFQNQSEVVFVNNYGPIKTSLQKVNGHSRVTYRLSDTI